ncbi:MAG: phosphatidylinositol-specific phospholipase C/glycerophosphodiester phosphodiesterase family protein [Armatimonadetes bacterium]|nr:phosphatidylinositol-specific phospholipase C/glycerophosphodiester phosphodiesterase family protein [Armatimonadota bacterium]
MLPTMVAVLAALTLISPVSVLPRAHSHNDYAQQRPLQEALDNGFSSVEADIFLVEGKLLVGHNREDLKPERNLEAMYLKPLADRIKQNHGWVYGEANKTLYVLVDIKSDGVNVYEAFKKTLTHFPELQYKKDHMAVRFIISGDRPIESIVRDKGLVAGLDGRWEDLSKGFSAQVMPWVSEDWLDHFKWIGAGEFPAEMQTKLQGMVKTCHDQGRKIRFWGAPDSKSVWSVHWKNGVDWLNTDHLANLRAWMLEQ